ncbi:MAG: imidazolonepropionase, partial [Gammaproteobacteria bacterium]
SEILESHRDCGKVQDPYCLRCVPQVHGASRDGLAHAQQVVETELNSVTDNPLVFEPAEIISGGNFHGQPLALVMDYAAIALAELASISERRTYLLLEGHDGLPKLLMEDTGVNSGFMIPQYTAAALVSENKVLCHPASVDSIPTSLGQEDHVSMGSISALKLLGVLHNVERVLAVELLTAAQALDFRRPLRPGRGVGAWSRRMPRCANTSSTRTATTRWAATWCAARSCSAKGCSPPPWTAPAWNFTETALQVLRNIGQLATCPPGRPQADAGLIDRAAVVIEDGAVRWSGPERELPPSIGGETLDCGGRLVIPGLVDCHTHLCFGGWRAEEFEQRLAGASYQDIAAGGGGILRTVAQTRAADPEDLLANAAVAVDAMLDLGVTTVECKSGYGLELETELRQLEVYRRLRQSRGAQLVSTFLGAHAVPPEFRKRPDAYVDLLCDELLPAVAAGALAEFCDVFVERGAFTVAQARRILGRARELGLGLKVHADQLSDGGGARLAAELGAVSAEHLEYANDDGIRALADAGTVAVSLPIASLYLRERYLPARRFLDAGVAVAVATDFNPGSAPSHHLPLALTLACLNQGMTPQEALVGATRVAARAIGRESRAGSLLPGYPADLAVLDAPDLAHWLYRFRPNACVAVARAGDWVRGSLPAADD